MLVSHRLMSPSIIRALPRCHVLALFVGKKGVEGIEQPQSLHHSRLLSGCWKTKSIFSVGGRSRSSCKSYPCFVDTEHTCLVTPPRASS